MRHGTVIICGALLLLCSAAAWAVPTVANVSPRHLLIGGTTTIAFDGADLAANPRLVAPFTIEKQLVKPGSSPQRVQFEITLSGGINAVQPGLYSVRVATDAGISAPLAVSVDRVPSQPFAPQVNDLPVALYGELTGQATLRTQFPGRKGQAIVVDVEARRLGGGLNPVVHLYDPWGVQLAWAYEDSGIVGDARLSAVLPVDGTYSVELHDSLYRGAGPGTFRLKIGELHYADLAFPLGIQRGSLTEVRYARSNFAGAALWDTSLDKTLPLGEHVAVLPRGVMGGIPRIPVIGPASLDLYPSQPIWATGVGPRVIVSDHTEFVESPATLPGRAADVPAAPVGINGRLLVPGEEDRFRLPVTPGARLKLDLLAQRVGSPLDGVLSVRTEQGQQLAAGDDRPGTTDPAVEFTVPAGVTAVVVKIKDLQNRGGADFVYRLSVQPEGQPDVGLSADQDTLVVPRGGRSVVRIRAARTGVSEAIVIKSDDLPPAFSLAGAEIASGSNLALVTISAGTDRSAAELVTFTGRSASGIVTRSVFAAERPDTRGRPWSRREFGLATGPPAPLVVDWVAASAEERAEQGAKLPMPVRIARAAGIQGPVRLSLLTTQEIPKKNVNNQQVDDLARAMRLESAVTAPPSSNDAILSVLIPGDLRTIAYDLVAQAELLSADGKQTLATTYTLPRRIVVVQPAKPVPKPEPSKPLVIFEDQEKLIADLSEGLGKVELIKDDKYRGAAAVKVFPEQRSNRALPGLNVKIRKEPVAGEYRYLRFAWKKTSGSQIAFQVGHDGKWGPSDGKPATFRYFAGPGAEPLGGALRVDSKRPNQWTVVTRDLFTDFGEFTFTGLALSPVDGDYGLYDHIVLGRTLEELDRAK